MLTEQDWKARQEAAIRTNRSPTCTLNEGYLKQAALDTKFLTASEEWNKYLQRLQPDLDAAEKELHDLYDKLGTPMTHEHLHLAYVAINVVQERIRVLTHCMTLPRELVNHATDLGLITGR